MATDGYDWPVWIDNPDGQFGGIPMADTYAATCPAGVGRYGGVVRDIHAGALRYCAHSHKRRSTALKCAESMLQEMSTDY